MIIDRYLIREIVANVIGVTLVLMLIFLSNRFVRYLSQAVSGEVPPDIIFNLLLLKSVSYLSLMLPLTTFLAVLLVFGRMYRDSEMVALGACGVGLPRLMKTMLITGLILGVVETGFALYVAPWAEEKGYTLQEEARSSTELSGITPGRFNESEGGSRVHYVERIQPDLTQMENIFIQGMHQGAPGVLSSDTGHQMIDSDTGDRFLVMRDGYRYEGKPGTADYKIVEFEKYAVRIEEKAVKKVIHKSDAKKTSELWGTGVLNDTAELQRRISFPLSLILLVLLAVPLSYTTPRQGKYAKVVWGIVIYILYINLSEVSYSSIAKGNLEPMVGVWWVHLVVICAIVMMMGFRLGFKSMFRIRR